jgi:signal transduction histidine kinase
MIAIEPRRPAAASSPPDAHWWALVAHVSHELRTPLNAALGFAQLLESDPAVDLPADRKAWLTHMAGACRHVVEIVQDLLDLSRLEQGGMPLSGSALALQPLALGVIGLLQPAAAQSGVTVHCIDETPPSYVRADARALRQVLINLLSNAIKYNRRGGRVELRLRAADSVAIEVSDTGCGLSPAQLAHLYEPFNRLGAEGSEVQGSGLGLVITRRLCEAMSGSIALHSEPGLGTRVVVTLPPVVRC